VAVSLFRLEPVFDELQPGRRVLDIGASGVHMFDPSATERFVTKRGGRLDEEWKTLRSDAWNQQQPLGSLLEQAGYLYQSYDIFPAYRTRIVDLNTASASDPESFDLILNFGTTEHIFNQYNAFKLIHDSCAPGGIMWHDVPMSGYFDHGYFNYQPMFFRNLAAANGYEIIRTGFSVHGGPAFDAGILPQYEGERFVLDTSENWITQPVPTAGLTAILRKTRSAPFRIALETQTSDAEISSEIAERYASTG